MLGLVAIPALEDTTVGGWIGILWHGSRGPGQPGQQAEPTAALPPTVDRQEESVGQRRAHAKPDRPGHGPKLQHAKGHPDRPAVTRRAARNPHAPSRPGRR
jgi:hypothetical protein